MGWKSAFPRPALPSPPFAPLQLTQRLIGSKEMESEQRLERSRARFTNSDSGISPPWLWNTKMTAIVSSDPTAVMAGLRAGRPASVSSKL